MAVFLLLIFQICLSDVSFAHSEVCNPIECFGTINRVFQDIDEKDSCVKMDNIEKCVGVCHPVLDDDSIIQGVQEVKKEICKNDQDNKLHNKCVDRQKYLLLFCIYESFNINALNPDTDPKLLMCRRIIEAEDCDLSTLVPCSQHANYIAEILLGKLFKPLHTKYCTFAENEIRSLNVTYPVFSNDYKNLATCFDLNSHLVDDCVLNKGDKNSVISSFFSYKLCKSVESFITCLDGIVQNRCSPAVETTFKLIIYSLYQSVLPKCFPYSNSNKASKGKLFNDKYVDPTEPQLKNSSGKIVVHQHVEDDHHHNATSRLINCFSVFFLLLSFCQFVFCNSILSS